MRKFSGSYLVPQGDDIFVDVSFKVAAVDANAYRRGGSGAGLPFQIGIYWHAKNPYRKNLIADPSPMASKRILAGQATPAEYIQYAKAISQRSFCNGGRVTENRNAGSRISDPAQIAAVVAASGGNVFDPDFRVPDNVKGTKVPVVEKREGQSNYWIVRLRCSLWRKS